MAEVLLTWQARGPGSGCEDLYVLRYEAGGEFTPHFDASPQRPRACTILYYLNGCGATWFPLADAPREPQSPEELHKELNRVMANDGLRVAGGVGDALAFYHFGDEGELDTRAIHAGVAAPATRWVASHFFHAARPA
eukprot:6777835-Prymnesium_polylepis.2